LLIDPGAESNPFDALDVTGAGSEGEAIQRMRDGALVVRNSWRSSSPDGCANKECKQQNS
jgi:hypothetical protein